MVCNGGNGIIIDNKLIENSPLDYDLCVAIANQAKQLGYGVLIADKDSKEIYGENLLFLKQADFRKEPITYYFGLQYYFSSFKNIYKMYISIPTEKE